MSTSEPSSASVKTWDDEELPLAPFDWRAPDYTTVFRARQENLRALNAMSDVEFRREVFDYYRDDPDGPANFISDWGITYEPRNPEIGLPAYVPFILFPRQREWVAWVLDHWRSRTPGLCEKSRDMGVSWLAMALSCTLCLFNDGVAVGVGSRKSEYVDKLGTMKPLLPKARVFMEYLPRRFKGDWQAWRDAPTMRVNFPETGSFLGGEGGDDIGRGDRTSLYFVDEFAHFERADLTEAALSQTTNCRIDMSSVRGMNNAFARKRWSGRVDIFIFDWHEDPRKNAEWYEKQQGELDPVVVAQEIDRDYQASVHGVVIPAAWARACVDALQKLGLEATGGRGAALDVADEGADKNAIALTKGVEVERTVERSGKGGDIFETVEWAFALCDEHGLDEFDYDADGLGAGVRGDARIINEKRSQTGKKTVAAHGFRGSEAVVDPDGIVEGTVGTEGDAGRTNKDYFLNRKAQAWWTVRRMAQRTYRWVVEGVACSVDDILSISSKDPDHMRLVAELSQATYKTNQVGKIVIDKTPNGMKSPNRADAVVMRYAPKGARQLVVSSDFMAAIAKAAPYRPSYRRGRFR